MRKVIIVLTTLMFLAVSNLKAQQEMNTSSSYTTAVGLKFYPGALTVKHFINDGVALEGIGYFSTYGFRITGLYEFHNDISSVEGLKWYVGPGVHVGFYDTRYGGGTALGIDGVLGLDYKFQGAPIEASVDWQPSFEFGSNYDNGFIGGYGGLGIRYAF
jgi:hypothetical protein